MRTYRIVEQTDANGDILYNTEILQDTCIPFRDDRFEYWEILQSGSSYAAQLKYLNSLRTTETVVHEVEF